MGALHHHSAHLGKGHDIMAYNMTFLGVHRGVAPGMEKSMVYPVHGVIDTCGAIHRPFHGENHGLTLTLTQTQTIAHAMVWSMVKP